MRRGWPAVLALLFILVYPTDQATAASCGTERWPVKVGTDSDTSLIDFRRARSTTIRALTSLAAPSSLPNDSRIQPVETTLWSLDATLIAFKLEKDSDYHLVIQDENKQTMIVEISDVAWVDASSPFSSFISSARAKFDALFAARPALKKVNVPVHVVGVGFFDKLHGQTGVAPNGIELHPVIDISFGPGVIGHPVGPSILPEG